MMVQSGVLRGPIVRSLVGESLSRSHFTELNKVNCKYSAI